VGKAFPGRAAKPETKTVSIRGQKRIVSGGDFSDYSGMGKNIEGRSADAFD
jgi:hypothetical protein